MKNFNYELSIHYRKSRNVFYVTLYEKTDNGVMIKEHIAVYYQNEIIEAIQQLYKNYNLSQCIFNYSEENEEA